MPRLYTNLINFILELLITFWMISRLKQDEPHKRLSYVLDVGFLMMLLPLYIFTDDVMLSQYVRIPYRLLCYFGLFKWGRRLSWGASFYYAALVTATHVTFTNIWTAPVVFALAERSPVITGKSTLDAMIVLCGMKNLLLLAISAVSRCRLFDRITQATQQNTIAALVALLCGTYVKQSLFYINKAQAGQDPSVSVYIILFSLFILLFLILTERSQRLTHEREIHQVEELSYQYRIKQYEAQRAYAQETRKLHHDMKNHLLALESLADKGDSEALQNYLSLLLGELSTPLQPFCTGNDLLDGILTEKSAEAEKEGISFSAAIVLDRPPAVSDPDLCTIFGNALDNAIEASRQVEDTAARYIQVRSARQGERLAVTFTNSYSGQLKVQDGHFLSTKRKYTARGIGMQSIAQAVDRCGAYMAVDSSVPQRFRLTVLFQLKDTDTKEG